MILLNIGVSLKITKIRTTLFLISLPKQAQLSPKRGSVFTVFTATHLYIFLSFLVLTSQYKIERPEKKNSRKIIALELYMGLCIASLSILFH